MSYNSKEIKKGITLHTIKTDKFKTNLLAIFLTFPIIKDESTKNTLIALMLKRGSKLYKTREDITNKLAEMYGASLDSGIEKSGDNHILKFYLESINEEYLPKKEDLLKESVNLLFDVGFNREVAENGALYWSLKENKLSELINKCDNIKYSEIVGLSNIAKSRVYDEYTWDKIIDEYEEVLVNKL